MLPYAGLVFVWRYLRDALGYGVANIGLYIDPMDQPFQFIAVAAGRAPFLLLGLWGLPPSDLAAVLGPGGSGQVYSLWPLPSLRGWR